MMLTVGAFTGLEASFGGVRMTGEATVSQTGCRHSACKSTDQDKEQLDRCNLTVGYFRLRLPEQHAGKRMQLAVQDCNLMVAFGLGDGDGGHIARLA